MLQIPQNTLKTQIILVAKGEIEKLMRENCLWALRIIEKHLSKKLLDEAEKEADFSIIDGVIKGETILPGVGSIQTLEKKQVVITLFKLGMLLGLYDQLDVIKDQAGERVTDDKIISIITNTLRNIKRYEPVKQRNLMDNPGRPPANFFDRHGGFLRVLSYVLIGIACFTGLRTILLVSWYKDQKEVQGSLIMTVAFAAYAGFAYILSFAEQAIFARLSPRASANASVGPAFTLYESLVRDLEDKLNERKKTNLKYSDQCDARLFQDVPDDPEVQILETPDQSISNGENNPNPSAQALNQRKPFSMDMSG